MANGYSPYILTDIQAQLGAATPSVKVDMHGLLKMLYSGAGAKPIQTNTVVGNKREHRFFYRQRNTVAQTDTSFSCDNVLTPSRLEGTVSIANTRQIAWHLPDTLMVNYNDEAAARTSIPGTAPAASATAELVDIIYSGCNAILGATNQDLWGLLTVGKNSVEGDALATTLNLPKDKTVQPLDQGMVKLLSDYKRNGMVGKPQIVTGAGLMYSFLLSQGMTNPDMYGFNASSAAAMFSYEADQDITSFAGATADDFFVFEPGTIQIAEYFANAGVYGRQLANSLLGTIVLPVVDPAGNAIGVKFDFQLKEIDCATTLTDAYSGGSVNVDRGHSLIISKQFGLWQEPADAYRHEDLQRSVNGCLHYIASNDCDTCS